MAPDTPERGGGRGDASSVHDRARVVRRYLSALDMRRPGRTAARTSETIGHRIHQVDTLLLSADPVQRLHLTQERIDLHAELLRLSTGAETDFAQIEAAFVRVVRGYSDRHGITFSAWRQIGVDVAVLERGGVGPSKSARPSASAAPAKAQAARSATAKPATQKATLAAVPDLVDEPAQEPAPEAVARPVARDPGCLDELPPVPRAEGPKATGTPAKPVAKKRTAAKTVKTTKAAKATRPAKKAAEAVQQQLPADSSS